MDKNEILEFITKNPIGYLATAEGSKPHVRAFGMFKADENGIIYFTQKIKDVYKQLEKNPEVEVCYFANGTQIRVAGKMKQLDDMNIKKAIVEKAPFLKPQIDASGWDYLSVWLLKGKAIVVDPVPGAKKNWIAL